MIRELAEQPKSAKNAQGHGSGNQGRRSEAMQKRLRLPEPAVWTEYEKLAVRTRTAQGRNVYHVTARSIHMCLMPIAARQLVLNALRASLRGIWEQGPKQVRPTATKQLELLVARVPDRQNRLSANAGSHRDR